MNHKGYTYKEETEIDDERLLHRYHFAVDPSGKEIHLDYSKWYKMTESAFKTLVELNFPLRRGNMVGPWNPEKLEEEYSNQYTILNDILTEL